jgi:hypothetical protein
MALHSNHPCFGLEHDRSKPECQRCVLFHLCDGVLGSRIALDHLEFELTPPELYANDDASVVGNVLVNRSNVEDLYRRCYYTVFGSRWPESSNLGKEWQKIVKNAVAAKVSLNTFIATVMAAWQLTHPQKPFYTSSLIADSSVEKVGRYSRMLRERYGYDGMDALGLFTDSETPRIEEQMMVSETLAGKWIVGWKMSRDGPAVQSLYKHHELALDPHWLASESTYVNLVLRPYLELESTASESAAIKAHRERVLSTHSMLKKRKTLARTIFSARSQIMPAALKSVLKGVGHLPENFTHPDTVVKDTIKFWNILGLAVTHWECLKGLMAEPNRLWR